jgi:hypothetical protein
MEWQLVCKLPFLSVSSSRIQDASEARQTKRGHPFGCRNHQLSTHPTQHFCPPSRPRRRLPTVVCSQLARSRFLITCLPLSACPHAFQPVHHLSVDLVRAVVSVLPQPMIGPWIRLMEYAHTANISSTCIAWVNHLGIENTYVPLQTPALASLLMPRSQPS